jgi:radical SAM protein with 4Fe4S-binding SPASM domain
MPATDRYAMGGVGHKLLWHRQRVADWMNGDSIPPLTIDMGITKACNIACEYCYYAVPENQSPEIIPTDSMIAFLKDAAEVGMKGIAIAGDGETMTHKGIYDIVEAGASFGLDMSVSTNGLQLKDDRAKKYLESLSWIRFHNSAGTPETYAKVMGTTEKNYHKFVENVRKCVELKKRYDLPVTIGMLMILVPKCASDIVSYAELGKELGVDYACIKQCAESTHVEYDDLESEHDSLDDFYQTCIPELRKAESLSDEKYKVIIKWDKMFNKGKRGYDKCYGCEFVSQISGNGDFFNCGHFFGDEKFLIGNIVKESFKDLVNSDRYKEVMSRVKTDVDVHKCGANCRQNEINEFLWKIKNVPEHVNFV